MERRVRIAVLALGCAVTVLLAPSATAGQPPAQELELPNLAARPSPYVESSLTYTPGLLGLYLDPPHEPRLLRLSARAANAGAYPLDLLGEPTADALALKANQCVSWTEAVCSRREPVGTMEWHQEHRHWHFNDFAVYELRRLLPDGTPDMSAAGLVGASEKASFCLMDSDRDQAGDPLVGTYQTCSGVLQGISPNWSDLYDSSLPGQEIPIDGVADGLYVLVITVDPLNRLRESDETDNQSFTLVEISADGTQARVVAPA